MNELEEALRRAAGNPGDRPHFYRVLLHSMLYAISADPAMAPGWRRVEAETTMRLVQWPRPDGGGLFLPIFTSLAAVEAVAKDAAVVGLAARDLFAATRGARLVLNPGHPYGKEFAPEEIAALLDGSLLAAAPEVLSVPAGTQVLLGHPVRHPHDLVTALRAFFPRHHRVANARLVHLHRPGEPAAHSLIAIEHRGDPAPLLGELRIVIDAIPPEHANAPVDLLVLDDGELSRRIRADFQPFYRRSLIGRLFGRLFER